MTRFTSYYPNVEFLSSQYLGDGPHNTFHQIRDYCREHKKMHTAYQPIYYNKGAKRRLVSYCINCKNAAFGRGTLQVVDYKYGGYYEVLDAVKVSGTAVISFEKVVMTAFNRNQNVSYNGSGRIRSLNAQAIS